MFKFDWLSFVKAHKISYVESGPNTAKGHISIKCPMCGDLDTSEHMGLCLNENAPYWGCFRNKQHRGKNVIFLVQKLLNCSRELAAQEVARFSGGPLRPPRSEINTQRNPGDLVMPSSFKPMSEEGYGHLFWEYLERRGFMAGHVEQVAEQYRLQHCLMGEWNMRLILPIYFEGRLVTWTGRSIQTAEAQPVRYKTLSPTAESGPQAKYATTELLLDHDNLQQGGKALVICEGPFDAIKLGFYLKQANMRATCLFTNNASATQLTLLAKLRDKFEQFIVLLDNDAGGETQAMRLAGELTAFHKRVRRVQLPKGVKDPGDLPMQGVIHLAATIDAPSKVSNARG